MKTARALSVFLLSFGGLAHAQSIVTVQQGGVARWAAYSATSCGLLGKRFPAVDGVCYYAADMRMKTGVHEIALYDEAGTQHLGSLVVQATEFPTIEIKLDDERYIDPDEAQTTRHREERRRVLALFKSNADEAQFTLPLKKPVSPLPESEDDFGSNRIFNGTHKSQHTGRDAPVASGTVVHSVAAGRVVLSEDHFFSGESVYVDHGAGLISMFFHLSERSVKTGDEIKAGDAIGKIGSTGRSTGPHLHIGMRWNGARIDPYLLFANPDTLPSVADTRAEAQGKINAAEEKEPAETDEK